MAETFDGDPWITVGFLALIIAGAVFSLGSLMLRALMSSGAGVVFITMMMGLCFFILGASLLGFVYLDPSPAD